MDRVSISTTRYRLRALIAGLGLLFWAGVSVASDADKHMLEYRVKSAFIYNFTKFVEWPAGSFSGDEDPIRLCVVGSDDSYGTLKQTVEGKQSQRRPLTVQRLVSRQNLDQCQLVYFAADPAVAWEWSEQIASQPVLTIGESSRFAELGGIIGFVIVDGKVRFDINQSSAESANIRISSKLLNLARIVRS